MNKPCGLKEAESFVLSQRPWEWSLKFFTLTFFISLHFKESYIEGSSEGREKGMKSLSACVLWFICIFNCANRGSGVQPHNLYYCPLCVVFINTSQINAYIIDLFSIKPKMIF